jgi:cytochrome c oxidase cbb3-type subunit 3
MSSPCPSLVLLLIALLLTGCKREDRELQAPPPRSEDKGLVALSHFAPGAGPPLIESSETGQHFNDNAYHISEGKRWFTWFSCKGCHGNGGGGSGPALMDDKWLYGGAIENIAATIREGRPNGMPTFRGRIPEEQIWQISAYVRSMSGNAPKAARPGRSDDLSPGPAEQSRKPQPPSGSGIPPSAQAPQ